MHEDLDRLEQELDTALAEWSDRLEVEPSPAVVARVQEAVRQELNETWLADQPIPLPSMEILEGVKSAVRSELRKVRWQKRMWRWAPVAAAAMIAVCVGLLQYARTGTTPVSPTQDFGQFADAANDVLADDPALLAIETELEALEQSIDQFSVTEDYYQSELDKLGDEMDTFESTLDRMSQASGGIKGALG